MKALDDFLAHRSSLGGHSSVLALHNAVAEKMNNTHIPQINNKYQGADFNKQSDYGSNKHAYEDEMKNAYLQQLKSSAGDSGTTSDGTNKYHVGTANNGMDWQVTMTHISHDDSSSVTVRVSRNEKSHIVGVKPVAPITHEDIIEDVLKHHGIKGQKWGVRRTRTELSSGRAARKAAKKAPEVTTAHRPGKKVTAVGGKQLPAHEDAIKAVVAKQKAKSSTTDSLSNDELKALVDRMNLEQNYSRLSKGKKTEGQLYIEKHLKQVGDQTIPKLLAKHGAKVAAAFAVG